MGGFSSRFADRVHNTTKRALTESFTFTDQTDMETYLIKGFYTENFQIVDTETEMIISSDEVMIDIISKDLPVVPAQGDTLTNNDTGTIYVIKDLHPDGQGAMAMTVFEKIP